MLFLRTKLRESEGEEWEEREEGGAGRRAEGGRGREEREEAGVAVGGGEEGVEVVEKEETGEYIAA